MITVVFCVAQNDCRPPRFQGTSPPSSHSRNFRHGIQTRHEVEGRRPGRPGRPFGLEPLPLESVLCLPRFLDRLWLLARNSRNPSNQSKGHLHGKQTATDSWAIRCKVPCCTPNTRLPCTHMYSLINLNPWLICSWRAPLYSILVEWKWAANDQLDTQATPSNKPMHILVYDKPSWVGRFAYVFLRFISTPSCNQCLRFSVSTIHILLCPTVCMVKWHQHSKACFFG